MFNTWQDVLALAIVATALTFIALRGYRTLFGSSEGCGGSCSGCSSKTMEPQGWVSLESLTEDVQR